MFEESLLWKQSRIGYILSPAVTHSELTNEVLDSLSIWCEFWFEGIHHGATINNLFLQNPTHEAFDEVYLKDVLRYSTAINSICLPNGERKILLWYELSTGLLLMSVKVCLVGKATKFQLQRVWGAGLMLRETRRMSRNLTMFRDSAPTGRIWFPGEVGGYGAFEVSHAKLHPSLFSRV